MAGISDRQVLCQKAHQSGSPVNMVQIDGRGVKSSLPDSP